MAGPTGPCFVIVDGKTCTRKSMKAVVYDLQKLPEILKVPVAFQIPMCGYHLGVVADNGADFMRAMDQLVDDEIPLTETEIEEINAQIHQEHTRVRRLGTEADTSNAVARKGRAQGD